MKFKPWLHKPGDTLKLGSLPNSVHLSDYVTGNNLSWNATEVNPPSTGSLATCSVTKTASPDFTCTPANTNGYANWKLIASDTGNIPATDHFTQELNFVVQISGVNHPPIKTPTLLPKMSLHEDQADTTLVLSKYYTDPDGGPLTFTVTGLNGSAANLLVTAKMTATSPSDTLHLQPFQLHHGLCSLLVSIRDNMNAIILDTLRIEVVHVNHPPQAADDGYAITESTPISFDVKKNDKDPDVGDVLKLAMVIPPKHGKADTTGQQMFYTPDSFYLGMDSLQYRLSDGLASSLAWVRIAVGATTAPLRIYKPLLDTTVPENDSASPKPIVIHTDSVFFSGSLRFNVEVFSATSDCQSIAKITHDRVNNLLTITPIRYQWGKCSISISSSVQSPLTSTMNLSVSSVISPYKFPKDTVVLSLQAGQKTVYPLDSIDLDMDTLSYAVSGGALSNWIQIKGFSLVFNPSALSLDTVIFVVARKKAGSGVTFTDSTDVLTLIAQVNTTSIKPRGQRIGGAYLSESGSRLIISGGASSFHVEILALNGQRLASSSAPEMGQVSFDSQSLPHLIFLRLVEGSHVTSVPLFLHH